MPCPNSTICIVASRPVAPTSDFCSTVRLGRCSACCACAAWMSSDAAMKAMATVVFILSRPYRMSAPDAGRLAVDRYDDQRVRGVVSAAIGIGQLALVLVEGFVTLRIAAEIKRR